MPPAILHLDIDAFFASVEQLMNPALRGRPVLVGTGVIASCSYEARRSGCRAGMPLRQARRLCPGAVVLEGNRHTYGCFAEATWEVCRRWLPSLELHLDDAYGDLTGTERLLGPPAEVGARLRREILAEVGLRVTVGIGTNRMIARLASKSAKPDGLAVVPPGAEADFVVGLPIEDLVGVGPATAATLRDMNLRTVRDLRVLPLATLEAMLGKNGAHLYERCRGRDSRPVGARELPTSLSRDTSLHRPTGDPAEVRAYLQYLAERALRTVRSLELEARRVAVRLRYEDGGGEEAGRTLERPTALDEELLPAAWELLARIFTRRVGVTHLGVALSRFEPAGGQGDFFEPRDRDRLRRLHAAIDAIRDKFGHSAVLAGPSIGLLGTLRLDENGFVLRTPSLTK